MVGAGVLGKLLSPKLPTPDGIAALRVHCHAAPARPPSPPPVGPSLVPRARADQPPFPALRHPAGLPNAVAWWGWIGGPLLLTLFFLVSLWTSLMLADVYR